MGSQQETMIRLDLSIQASNLIRKIDGASIKLDELCYINYGAQMSSKVKGKFGKDFVIRSKAESQQCKKMISGRDLYRYSASWDGKYVDWSLADQMYGPRWPRFFESDKLMVRDITGTHRIESTLDTTGLYCDHTILCAVRKSDIKKDRTFSTEEIAISASYDLKYLCGCVTSSLVSTYCYLVLTGEGIRTGGGFHTYPHTIRQFPICRIDFANPIDKSRHDRMVALVDGMLGLHKKLAAARTDQEKTGLRRQIEATDRQIDQLVYELYGLSDDDIRLVEASAAGPTPRD